MMIEVRLANAGLHEQVSGVSRAGEPVRCGIPLPRGWMAANQAWLRVQAGDGSERISQTRVTQRWPDGSAKWVLVDWLLTSHDEADNRFELHKAAAPTDGTDWYQLADDSSLTVTTQAACYRLQAGETFPVTSITQCHWSRPLRPALQLVFADNENPATLRFGESKLIEAGPVCLSVEASAQVIAPSLELPLICVTRLTFYRQSAAVRATVALTNPNAAAHPGGMWELGSGGAVLLRALSFDVLTDGQAQSAALWLGEGDTVLRHQERVGVHQESSGGEQWDSPTHFNRHGELPLRYRGFHAMAGDAVTQGLRAQPVLQMAGDAAATVALAAPCFWQNFPRGLYFEKSHAHLALFPGQCADVHELQGGERKTHEFWWAIDDCGTPPLSWCSDPAVAHVATDWVAATGVVPYIKGDVFDDAYRFYLTQVLAGDESFEAKRERIDEYGWRNFGDINADHEAAFDDSSGPFISHYNNQYDSVNSFGAHFLRSGDIRWFRHMDELARHLTDIDTYHTSHDKAAYNHGMFWHTVHYAQAGLATHRTFPRAQGVQGGGPSPEHLYTTGLALHYRMTGSEDSYDAVINYGCYVIAADDGSLTPFRLLSSGPTGIVSCSGTMDYHGPGRGPGNAIEALMNAFDMSGERRFLAKAEELLCRCVHPHDDLAARNLLDVERRWYYMVFLRALTKYLELKRGLGEIDWHYAYARESLLAYVRWAADHEYPYIDKPEMLEFPNETWPAQELRKSDVFELAACYAHGEWRERFRERARFFYAAALDGLSRYPDTRFRARPMVLLLGFGVVHATLRAAPVVEDNSPVLTDLNFGAPVVFVRQKRIAMQRAAIIAICSCVAAVVGVVALIS